MNWKKAHKALRIIDSLVKNLEGLSLSTTNKFFPVEETKLVLWEVKFMRHFLQLLKHHSFECGDAEFLFKAVEDSAIELSAAICFFVRDEIQENCGNAGIGLGDRLDKAKSLQLAVKDFYDLSWETRARDTDDPATDLDVVGFSNSLIQQLRDVLCRNIEPGILDVMDQINILVDELSFVRCSIMDMLLQAPSDSEGMNTLITSTRSLIKEARHFVHFSCGNDMQDMHFSSNICNLLESVDTANQNTNGTSNPSSRTFDRSVIEGLPFVDFFITKCQKLKYSGYLRHHHLEPLFETLCREMLPVYKCLDYHPDMQCFVKPLTDAAYLANYVIYSFRAPIECLPWYQKLGLFVAMKDVRIIQNAVKLAASKKMHIHDSSQAMGAMFLENNSQSNIEETSDKLEVFRDAERDILNLLSSGSKQLKILSVVGMPGLGKSTLANSVYKHPLTVGCFHVRAWCCITEVYEKETCINEMLGQIIYETNVRDEACGDDVCLKLYRALKGRRYLIVLDDVWDSKVWNDIKFTFPDDGNGSRILFTTRHRVVASEADSIIYHLRMLTNKESCDLLWFKLFGSETCPKELLVISKHIARRCRGLPLSVVLIAGVLKRTTRSKESWEEVFKKFFWSIYGKRGHREYINVLESSYSHLPNQLKPCFLYLGAFPRRTEIPVAKLTRLWICEGLVQETIQASPLELRRSSDQVAQDCLNELIDRSLVMVVGRSSLGGVKTCCVHDVLRDFCSGKIAEERFLTQENEFGGTSIVCSSSQNLTRTYLYDHKSDRVMISGSGNEQWTYIPLSSRDTSLEVKARKGLQLSDRVLRLRRSRPIFSRHVLTEGAVIGLRKDTSISRLIDYNFIFSCTLLRVLDLANVRAENSADTRDLLEIFELIHLTYLAIRVCTSEIPAEIANLRDLETFHLLGAIGEVIMPEALWSLLSLNDVLTDHSFFSFQRYSQDFFEDITEMDAIKSISNLYLSHGDDVERLFLRRVTELQKLGCRFSNSWDDSSGCNFFRVLNFLSKLKSLKVFFSSKALCPFVFSFPSQLKKLSLSNSRLPWDEISVIMEQLPNLEVLKLLNKAFEGPQWDMEDGEILFPKLKFLKLDSLDIQVWNAELPLPCLEQLVVLSCPQLQEIPSSFGEISTLQSIEMNWCSLSAMDSVQQILQVQHDFSNDDLKVTLLGSA